MIIKGIVTAQDEIQTISQDGCGSFTVKVTGGNLNVGDIVELEALNVRDVKLVVREEEQKAVDSE